MTAKEYLNQVPRLDTIIDLKLAQVERLKSLRERVTTIMSDTPKGGGCGDRVVEITNRIWALEEEINRDIDRLVDMRKEREAVIDTVQDATLRDLLTYRYIHGCKWECVAKKIGQTIHMTKIKLHPKALDAIKNTIYSGIY